MAFDKTDFGIAAGGAVAFLLGWRRLAGVVWGVGGLYEYSKGHKVAGSLAMVGGTSFLFFPEWPGSLVGLLSSNGASSGAAPSLPKTPSAELPPPQAITISPYQRVSYPSLDRLLNGDWRMLDVRDIRDAKAKARAGALKVGDDVALVLQNKTGPFLVFKARVLGGSAETMYNAQWLSGPPASGPQMIDFGPEHVFTVN